MTTWDRPHAQQASCSLSPRRNSRTGAFVTSCLVGPKTIDLDDMAGTFFGVLPVGAHDEAAARYKNHAGLAARCPAKDRKDLRNCLRPVTAASHRPQSPRRTLMRR